MKNKRIDLNSIVIVSGINLMIGSLSAFSATTVVPAPDLAATKAIDAATAAAMPAVVKAPAPCAVVIKAEHGFSVTDKTGKATTQFTEQETPIECGSTVSTHEGTAWIRTQSLVNMKFAPQTYFEFNKSDKTTENYTLYRGKVILQSPPLKKSVTILTNQARINFTGGAALVNYFEDTKITQVASFNRSVTIQNRYNADAVQVVGAGQMSGLDFSDPRVVPKQPKVMSSANANELLTEFKISAEEKNEMVNVVDRVYDSRSKDFSAELESWKDIEKPQEDGRSLASEAKKDMKPKGEAIETIQEREASFVMEQFKKRVYGEVDETTVDPIERAPASKTPVDTMRNTKKISEKIIDSEYEEQNKKSNLEKKKLIDKISDQE